MKTKLYILFILLTINILPTMADNPIVIDNTFEINPDFELLTCHEWEKGIKIKGVKVKQIQILNRTIIKNPEIKEGPPNYMYVVIELTDMQGEKIELFGGRPLNYGDFVYRIKDYGDNPPK